MAASINLYAASGRNIKNVGDKGFKAMLLAASYVPNASLHEFRSDISQFEITVSGYPTGGTPVVPIQWVYDSTQKRTNITAGNPTWSAMTTSVRYIVFYVDTGDASTDFLMSYIDLGQTVDMSAQGIIVTLPGGSFYRLQVPASV